jgi:hypothetical protein
MKLALNVLIGLAIALVGCNGAGAKPNEPAELRMTLAKRIENSAMKEVGSFRYLSNVTSNKEYATRSKMIETLVALSARENIGHRCVVIEELEYAWPNTPKYKRRIVASWNSSGPAAAAFTELGANQVSDNVWKSLEPILLDTAKKPVVLTNQATDYWYGCFISYFDGTNWHCGYLLHDGWRGDFDRKDDQQMKPFVRLARFMSRYNAWQDHFMDRLNWPYELLDEPEPKEWLQAATKPAT